MTTVPKNEFGPPDHTTTVAIVDDDVWMRTGRATALGAFDDITVLHALDPQSAVSNAALVAVADVVLVDAHDPDAGFDRFNGVEVVRCVRAARSGRFPVIVVLTGHAGNELLRRRMAEAGADFLYAHREVQSAERLAMTIRAAAATEVGERLVAELTNSVNEVVEWAERNLGGGALVEESQKSLPVSRRQIISARQRVASAMGLDGDAAPSWRTAASFLNRARGKDGRKR